MNVQKKYLAVNKYATTTMGHTLVLVKIITIWALISTVAWVNSMLQQMASNIYIMYNMYIHRSTSKCVLECQQFDGIRPDLGETRVGCTGWEYD